MSVKPFSHHQPLIRSSLKVMWQGRSVLSRILLVPTFVLVTWRLVSVGLISERLNGIIFLFIEATLSAYVGVRWVRWLLLGELPPLGSNLLRLGPGGRIYLTFTLLFGTAVMAISFVLTFFEQIPLSLLPSASFIGDIGASIVRIFFWICPLLVPLFLKARLGFAWIDAALEIEVNLSQSWAKTARLWWRLWRSLMIVVWMPLFTGGLLLYVGWLLFSDSIRIFYDNGNTLITLFLVLVVPLYAIISMLLQLTLIASTYRQSSHV